MGTSLICDSTGVLPTIHAHVGEPGWLEMLADWIGAGKAYGNPNTREWYLKNMGKMQLNPETRYYVEKYLGLR